MRFSPLVRATILLWLGFASVHAAMYDVAQQIPNASDDSPGTSARPWRTLANAAARAQAGDLVRIHSGIYREHVIVRSNGTSEKPIRFETAAGEQVIVTGADRLTGWQKEDGENPVYRVPWTFRFNAYSQTMTHPGDAYHRVIGRCEQVFIDGYLLRQVLSLNQLAPGTFFADTDNRFLYVWDSANRDVSKTFVESSARAEIVRVEGAHVQICGLKFRYAANAAQHGAVILAGDHDLLEDCAVEDTNASGAGFLAPDLVVRRCTFRRNGQLGFGANGAHRLLFSECIVEDNNTKNFSRGWEAGGNKLVLTRGAVLEKSVFLRNRGNGIWFDIGNEDCTVRNCLLADNEDAGIFYEISFGLHAHDNVLVGNGFAETAGAWGAQAAICLSSSPGGLIERNLLVGNREGFAFREQDRTTPTVDDKVERPVWNHGEIVRNNIIAYNRDAQIWGWFDVDDRRVWPSLDRKAASSNTRGQGSESIRATVDSKSQSPRVTLEDLDLHFENNVYAVEWGQGNFNWGPTWRKHRQWQNLAGFQEELGIDRGSVQAALHFRNVSSRDFRLSPEEMKSFAAQYPRGVVPGVRLGMEPQE